MEVSFHSQEEKFNLNNPEKIISWLKEVCKKEDVIVRSLDYIFVSDKYLLDINLKYLNHDTYTDIITFNLGDGNDIEGEVYISIDRVIENSQKFKVEQTQELNRVVLHGLLHLLGYDDHTPEEKAAMRLKEDQYLAVL
ncbi:MAG: putative rRNA maturation factor [Ulvibacter sp.]|jgi:probable rRNA maturation factor